MPPPQQQGRRSWTPDTHRKEPCSNFWNVERWSHYWKINPSSKERDTVWGRQCCWYGRSGTILQPSFVQLSLIWYPSLKAGSSLPRPLMGPLDSQLRWKCDHQQHLRSCYPKPLSWAALPWILSTCWLSHSNLSISSSWGWYELPPVSLQFQGYCQPLTSSSCQPSEFLSRWNMMYSYKGTWNWGIFRELIWLWFQKQMHMRNEWTDDLARKYA